MKYKKKRINQKQSLKTTKKEINFFFSNRRYQDSVESLFIPEVYAASGCGCCGSCDGNKCCVLPDSWVHMADNTVKKAKDVSVGDNVLSFDTAKGRIVTNRINGIDVVHNKNGFYNVNSTLHITGEHPVFVNQREWRKMKEIRVGDTITTLQVERTPVVSITKLEGLYKVYSFHVGGPLKNYFVENTLVQDYTSRIIYSSGSPCQFHPSVEINAL